MVLSLYLQYSEILHLLDLGDEFILDCRVMEISRAIEKRPSHLIQSSYEPDSALEEVIFLTHSC